MVYKNDRDWLPEESKQDPSNLHNAIVRRNRLAAFFAADNPAIRSLFLPAVILIRNRAGLRSGNSGGRD